MDAEGHDIRGLAEFIIAKHRSGATDTVPLRFVSQFARFENEGDQDLTSGVKTYDSKMNADTNAPVAPSGPPTPPPPNEDFLPSPGEVPTPF